MAHVYHRGGERRPYKPMQYSKFLATMKMTLWREFGADSSTRLALMTSQKRSQSQRDETSDGERPSRVRMRVRRKPGGEALAAKHVSPAVKNKCAPGNSLIV